MNRQECRFGARAADLAGLPKGIPIVALAFGGCVSMTSAGIRQDLERDMDNNPPKLEVVENHDRFRDSHTWMTQLFFVAGGPSSRTGSLPGISFAAAVQRNGADHPDEPNRTVHVLIFQSDSRSWRFLESDRNVDLILNGQEKMHLGPASHAGDVGGVAVVGAEETMQVAVTWEQLAKLSQATSIEVQLGSAQFALRPNQIAAMRALVTRAQRT